METAHHIPAFPQNRELVSQPSRYRAVPSCEEVLSSTGLAHGASGLGVETVYHMREIMTQVFSLK